MARLQCLTCGGTYDDVSPDGVRYFHTCPPLAEWAVALAVEEGRLVLPPDEAPKFVAEADEAPDDAKRRQLLEHVRVSMRRRTYHRADARNENAVQVAHPDAQGAIVAEGKGTAPADAVIDPGASVTVAD